MNHVELGSLIAPAKPRRAGSTEYPVLSITMRDGLVNQADKFKKRIASTDTSPYKVVERNQLVVGFPIDEGVLAFQRLYDEAIVSPAYGIWSLRDGASVDHEFLEKYLRSTRALAFYQSKLRSTTARRRSLPNDIFLSLDVPLPPLPEQERIVKLLGEADELRKLRAQADRRTAQLVPALFHETFGDPGVNPRGWRMSELGVLCDLLTGFPFKSGEYVDSVEAVRLCRGANVLPQRIDWSDTRCWPKDRVAEVHQYILREGDIILAMDRPWISSGLKVARLSHADLPSLLVQRVARIRPKEVLEPDFLYHLLCHESFTAHCRLVKTETTIPHISPSDIRSFSVIVPPLPLQHEFAQRVTEIRAMEAEQAASRQRLEALFQSMLHRAFNGEL